ncbi:MAG: pyridoxamine 5'-phosphate oxidase family protein [Smithellaceae bacterium]
MNQEQLLQFLNAYPVCYLATTEGNQPRVRGMMMYRADSTGIIFHTGAFKSLCSQIKANNLVEICFSSQDTQVRVAGIAEIIDDLNLKKEIVEARPFLKSLIDQNDYDSLIVFRVTKCKAAVWTMKSNLEATKYTDM